MPGPICRCPRGHVFQSRSLGFENVTNARFSGNGEPCIYPGCGLQATTIDATYDFLPDSVRVAIAQTASPEERAAIQGFVAALSTRDQPPTPEEVDEEFRDVDPRLREWIKSLILTVDWPRVKRLLREVLPLVLAVYLSLGTDAKVEAVGTQVETVDEQIQELNRR